MGNYLNPGNDMFYKIVHSEIYVDKTGLIGYCNHVISTQCRDTSVSADRDVLENQWQLTCCPHIIAENVIRKNCLKDWKFQKRADLKSI